MVRAAPNILLIMADQLAPQALPCHGHTIVKAPHISALANGGTLFESAYANFPLCAPSRASLLTGRYASAVGVWDNATELAAGVPTMAHYLRAAGYSAILCGKMHFIGPDQLHGFSERLVTDIYPSNFAWTPDWTEGPRNRPTGINMRAVTESGACVRSLQIDYDEEVEFFAAQKIYDLVRFTEKQPFFLTVSFTHPHSPFVAKQEYWDRYRHCEIDMPAVPPIALEQQDEMSRWLHYAHGGDLDEVGPEHVRKARHAYYAMVSYIDDKVGRLLATLAEVGLDKSTIVVFTSDHGEMLGERGAWYKQYFFEWSARVPMIVAGPGLASGRRVAAPVSLVDLLPTFLELAAPARTVGPVHAIAGASLLPVLTGAEQPMLAERSVISEYTGEGACAPCRMIRSQSMKLIYTHGHPDQLFDLASDPQEVRNVADEPKHAATRARLKAELLADWDPDRIHERVLQSQRERRLIQDVTGGDPVWAFKTRADDDRRYVRNSGAVQAKSKARYPFLAPPPIRRA